MKKEMILTLAFAIYGVTTLIAMAPMSLGAVGVFAALMVYFGGVRSFKKGFLDELQREDSKTYLHLSLVLIFTCVLSLVGAYFYPLSYGGKFSEVHFLSDLSKVWYLFWPLILVMGLRRLSPDQKKTVLKSWLIAFFILSVIGFIQYWSGWPRPQVIPGNGHYHTTGFLGHHLSVASIFIFPFFVSLEFLFDQRKRQSLGLPTWFLSLTACFGFLALMGTFSRTLWMGLFLGIALGLILMFFRRFTWKTFAGVASLAVLGWGVSQVPFISSRIHQNIGIFNRTELWKANWEFFKSRPLTGVGWHHNLELSGYYLLDRHPEKNSVFSGHAHNNLIDALGSTGLLGALAWLAWSIFVIRLLFKKNRNLSFAFPLGLLTAWFVFHVNGLTQLNFWEGKVTHQMMWMVAWTLLWVESSSEKNKKRMIIDARMVGAIPHGFARYVTKLAEGLAQQKIEYEVFFLMNSQYVNAQSGQTHFCGFPVIQTRTSFLSLGELVEIPYLLWKYQADLYHSPSFSSLLYSPCPWIVTVHDLNHLTYGRPFHKFYYHFLLRPFMKKAKQVITVSEFSRGEIADWMKRPLNSIEIVYNAISSPGSSGVTSNVLEKRGLRPYSYFFCLSNSKPHKNTSLLIEAYKNYSTHSLNQNKKPWDLVLSLNPPASVEKTPGIHFLGGLNDEDGLSLLKRAGAVVFPSLYEGFGLPPVEAAAAGVPLVVSKIPPHQEGLRDLKNSEVIWVDPQSQKDWETSLEKAQSQFQVLSQRSERVSESSKNAVLDRFSVLKMGKDMDRIYQIVLGIK